MAVHEGLEPKVHLGVALGRETQQQTMDYGVKVWAKEQETAAKWEETLRAMGEAGLFGELESDEPPRELSQLPLNGQALAHHIDEQLRFFTLPEGGTYRVKNPNHHS